MAEPPKISSRVLEAFAEIMVGSSKALVAELLPGYTSKIINRAAMKLMGVEYSSGDIDERIRKLDAARENLAEALEAMDELKEMATTSQAKLKKLESAVAAANAEKATLATNVEELRKLGSIERETIRTAFNLPSKSQVRVGYLISFVGGLVTTLLFTALYDFVAKPVFMHFFPNAGTSLASLFS